MALRRRSFTSALQSRTASNYVIRRHQLLPVCSIPEPVGGVSGTAVDEIDRDVRAKFGDLRLNRSRVIRPAHFIRLVGRNVEPVSHFGYGRLRT